MSQCQTFVIQQHSILNQVSVDDDDDVRWIIKRTRRAFKWMLHSLHRRCDSSYLIKRTFLLLFHFKALWLLFSPFLCLAFEEDFLSSVVYRSNEDVNDSPLFYFDGSKTFSLSRRLSTFVLTWRKKKAAQSERERDKKEIQSSGREWKSIKAAKHLDDFRINTREEHSSSSAMKWKFKQSQRAIKLSIEDVINQFQSFYSFTLSWSRCEIENF